VHRKSPRLRTVFAQFFNGHHLQDRLISVTLSPDNPWTYRNVITAADSLVLRVAASERSAIVAPPNLSASVLVNHNLVHRIRKHPRLQHCHPSPIGQTAISDRLAPSIGRQPVYSVSVTVLVFPIIVKSAARLRVGPSRSSSYCPPHAVSAASLITSPKQLFQTTQDVPERE
jgi:hypothetical protein